MHVAKVVRSGGKVTIELPAGFEMAEGEMEVRHEGEGVVLAPIPCEPGSKDEWAWLDNFAQPSPEVLEALDELDRNMAEMRRQDLEWPDRTPQP